MRIGYKNRAGSHQLPGDICNGLHQALKAEKSDCLVHVRFLYFNKGHASLAHFWKQNARFPGGASLAIPVIGGILEENQLPGCCD